MIEIEIIKLIKRYIKISKNDLIIEPSAGNGEFTRELKKIYKNVLSFDIEPDASDIIKQDYLELDLSNFNNKIHIIGNPPFGRQSSLAKQFIKKSCEYCETISFILPKSFKKDSLGETLQ